MPYIQLQLNVPIFTLKKKGYLIIFHARIAKFVTSYHKLCNAISLVILNFHMCHVNRGVNVRPNRRTQHEPDTGFFGLGLGLNGFGS